MDFTKLIGPIVEIIAKAIGFGKQESSSPKQKSGTEIRAEFKRRLDRGETITDEELLSVPLYQVPAELADQYLEAHRRSETRQDQQSQQKPSEGKNAVRSAPEGKAKDKSNSSGESISDRWIAEAGSEPARKLADDIKTISNVPESANETALPQPATVQPPAASSPAPPTTTTTTSDDRRVVSDADTHERPPKSQSENSSSELSPTPSETTEEYQKPTIIEKWTAEALNEDVRSLDDDVATINATTPEAQKIAADEVSQPKSVRPALPKSGSVQPGKESDKEFHSRGSVTEKPDPPTSTRSQDPASDLTADAVPLTLSLDPVPAKAADEAVGEDQQRINNQQQDNDRKLPDAKPDGKAETTIIEKWITEASGEPGRSLSEDMTTIGDATTQAAAAAADDVAVTPIQPPKPSPKPPSEYPKFYHQRDPSGNTMAELLTARDGPRIPGRTKASVKRDIKAWSKHFDAQQKGPSQRPDYNSTTNENTASENPLVRPPSSPTKTEPNQKNIPTAENPSEKPAVRDQWKKSEQPSDEDAAPVKETNGETSKTDQAKKKPQDQPTQSERQSQKPNLPNSSSERTAQPKSPSNTKASSESKPPLASLLQLTPATKQAKQAEQQTSRQIDKPSKLPLNTPSVRDQWRQSQQKNPDGTSPVQGATGDQAETVKAVTEAQDRVSEGESQPKQVQTSTPLPNDVVQQQNAATESANEPSRESVAADSLQLGLDTIGVFGDAVIPGAGVAADGANAAISVGRMFTDPERRGEHARNAAISTVSMIPFVGDIAKVFKAKSAAKTVGRATKMAKGVKAGNGAELAAKQKRREQLRDETKKAIGGDDGGDIPTSASSSSPGSGGDQREEAKAVEQHDRWAESLKGGGEKVLQFTGLIGKAGATAIQFVAGLSLLNTGVIALNRDLAQYNGTLAGAYARSDAKQIQRDIRKGEELSGPLSRLTEQQSELKDSLQSLMLPIQATLIEILAAVTFVVNASVELAKASDWRLQVLNQIYGVISRAGDAENVDWVSFYQDLSDGKLDGKRPVFDGKRSQILKNEDHKEVFGE